MAFIQQEDIKNISLIGAGYMGHGIAQIFATKNFQVRLYDIEEEPLSKAIEISPPASMDISP